MRSFVREVYLVQDAAGREQLRHQARIAEPLQAYEDLSAGVLTADGCTRGEWDASGGLRGSVYSAA